MSRPIAYSRNGVYSTDPLQANNYIINDHVRGKPYHIHNRQHNTLTYHKQITDNTYHASITYHHLHPRPSPVLQSGLTKGLANARITPTQYLLSNRRSNIKSNIRTGCCCH